MLGQTAHTPSTLQCSCLILPHHRTIMRCANAIKYQTLSSAAAAVVVVALPPAAAAAVAMTCRSGGAAIVAIAGFSFGLSFGCGVPIKLLFSAEY